MACSDKRRYLIAKPKETEPQALPEPKLVKVKARITETRLFGRYLVKTNVSYILDIEVEP